MPRARSTSCSSVSGRRAFFCSPGIRSATATYIMLDAASASAYGTQSLDARQCPVTDQPAGHRPEARRDVEQQRLAPREPGVQQHEEVADFLRHLVRDDRHRRHDASRKSARNAAAMTMPSQKLWKVSPIRIIQPDRR